MSEPDRIGYGATPPFAGWPGWARVAVNFVVHYHDDADEYATRAGFWRLHRLLGDRRVPATVFAAPHALERNPAAIEAMLAAGWEIAASGRSMRDDQPVSPDVEREQIAETVALHTRLTGERPLGWYQECTSPDTARLICELGDFVYDSGSGADDMPYYDRNHGRAQLIVPYARDTDDGSLSDGDAFFHHLRDTFEQLRGEGGRMMSVGLHGHVAGRPGRALATARFVDHVLASGDAWVARRIDIARHWLERHPA